MANQGIQLKTGTGFLRRAMQRLQALVYSRAGQDKREFIMDAKERVAIEIKDFASGSVALFWQRQAMYIGAALLAGYYFEVSTAVFSFLLCQLTELLDVGLALKVLKWPGKGARQATIYKQLLLLTSILNSMAVAYFAYTIARLEGPTVHFAPLFFLFAAGLFAAINNRQMPRVLYARLVIYGAVFLIVPLRDIWEVSAPLKSPLWMQFMTVIFVLYFVVDCSLIFLKLYKEGLDKLEELTRERDRAKAALEVKSQFVSTVSHELRTPLTSIIGALDMLKSGVYDNSPEKAHRAMCLAHENSRRLANLINDILDVQKLEAGKMSFNLQPLRLSNCVQEAVNSVTGMSDSKKIEMHILNLDPDLVVKGDHQRVLQVLTNLLSNAIKFSSEGGMIELDLRAGEGMARLLVRDHGIGIPEGSEEKVFGRFSQIDLSDHRKYQGSGLGLNISREIVTAHSGTLSYESEIGKGTTFCLELPIA